MGWFGFSRFVVEGTSMIPTYAIGDRLLVRRRPEYEVGDVVVARDPRSDRPILKRIVAVDEHGNYVVQGDNAAASTDSRTFGPVSPARVTGVVIRRY